MYYYKNTLTLILFLYKKNMLSGIGYEHTCNTLNVGFADLFLKYLCLIIIRTVKVSYCP